METNVFFDTFKVRTPPSRANASGIYINGDKVASLGRSSKSRQSGSHDPYSSEYHGGDGTAHESTAGERRSRYSSSSPNTLLLSRSPKKRGWVQIIQDNTPRSRSKSRDRSDDIALGPFGLAKTLGIVSGRRRSREYSSEPRIIETTYSVPKSPRRRASTDEGRYVYDDSREYRRARRGSTPRPERPTGDASLGREAKPAAPPTENWSTKAEPPYSRYGGESGDRKPRRSATLSGDIPPAVKQLRFDDNRRARIDRQNEEINRRRPMPSADRSAPGRGILKHLGDDGAGPSISASAPASMHATPDVSYDTSGWAPHSPKTPWPRSDGAGAGTKGKRRESFGGAVAVQDDEQLKRAVEDMNLEQFQMPEQRKWSSELAASRTRNRDRDRDRDQKTYKPYEGQGGGYCIVEQDRPRGRERNRDRRARRASTPAPGEPVYYGYGDADDTHRAGRGRDRDGGGGGGSRPKKSRWVVIG